MYPYKFSVQVGDTVGVMDVELLLRNVLKFEFNRDAYMDNPYCTARTLSRLAETATGHKVGLILKDGWKEGYKLTFPKYAYTCDSFDELLTKLSSELNVDIYESTAGVELAKLYDKFTKNHMDFGAVLGMKALISHIHETGPDQPVFVALFKNGEQEDSCQILHDEEDKFKLLERIANRGDIKLTHTVRKIGRMVEVFVSGVDLAMLEEKGRSANHFVQEAVNIALYRLRD